MIYPTGYRGIDRFRIERGTLAWARNDLFTLSKFLGLLFRTSEKWRYIHRQSDGENSAARDQERRFLLLELSEYAILRERTFRSIGENVFLQRWAAFNVQL